MARLILRQIGKTAISALVLFALLVRTTAARNALAATSFTVNSALDQIDDHPGDGLCHTAANTCTLRAAVMEANHTSGVGATVLVPAGVYTLTLSAQGPDDETTGDLNLTTPAIGSPIIVIQGAGADVTTIDANQLDRVFNIAVGRVAVIASVTIRNGYVTTPYPFGGGILNQGDLTIEDSLIIGNRSPNFQNSAGGGIESTGLLQIFTSVVLHNYAGVSGGGIDGNNIDVHDTLILSNTATLGGGMAAYDIRLVNSAVIGNIATNYGGGILVSGIPGARLVNSTVSGNFAVTYGGGIVNGTYSNDVRLYNVTVANNQADSDFDGFGSGGGIANLGASSTEISNTLIAGNFGSGCAAMVCFSVANDCDGALASFGYNLIQTLTSDCTVSGTTTGNQYNLDPLLGPLQDNGGPTPTHALLRGSPAIDAGSLSGCLDDYGGLLATDQRGWARVVGGRCDLGAYEAPLQVFLALLRR